MKPALAIRDLSIRFDIEEGSLAATDGVSLEIAPGETVGLVGESGCGKSVTALSILGLIPQPPGRIASGSIEYGGFDLASADVATLRRVRGDRISMIFQEPMTSLSPLHRIGDQLVEALRAHRDLPPMDARATAVEWLKKVGIADAETKARCLPHELSGGMRQRVMIAMALMMKPDLLIADEPTTALDVTIQAQVLELIKDMQEELGMAVLLITHDLAVVAETCSRVVVMYAGRIVEDAPVKALFEKPLHPYAKGLLASIPSRQAGRGRLEAIPGSVPSPFAYPTGCRFHDRCSERIERCRAEEPSLSAHAGDRFAACWVVGE